MGVRWDEIGQQLFIDLSNSERTRLGAALRRFGKLTAGTLRAGSESSRLKKNSKMQFLAIPR